MGSRWRYSPPPLTRSRLVLEVACELVSRPDQQLRQPQVSLRR